MPQPRQENDRDEGRRALAAVRRWGCQYQAIDLDAVAASDLDFIALEPSLDDDAMRFIGPADILRLQRKPDGSRRIVIAYLPLGEADVKRWYMTPAMRADPPRWLGRENRDWPGARHVRYWDPEWHQFVATGERSLLRQIVEAGFDGALLDRVDAYGDWADERPSAQDDMIALVEKVGATARTIRPGFLLVPQNAEHLTASSRYRAVIDGLNKESLLTGLHGPGLPNSQNDIDWSLTQLRVAQQAGVQIFATEYVERSARRELLAKRLKSYGFIPFFSVRALDQLPG